MNPNGSKHSDQNSYGLTSYKTVVFTHTVHICDFMASRNSHHQAQRCKRNQHCHTFAPIQAPRVCTHTTLTQLLILFFLFTTALLGSSKKGESPNQPPWERIHIQLWSGVSKNLEYIQWGQGKLSSYLIVWIERMQQNSFQGEQFSCTFTCVRNPDEASGDVYNPMNQTKVDLKC